jgi:hypothetical protein
MKNIFNLLKESTSDKNYRERWDRDNPMGKNPMNPEDYNSNVPGYHFFADTLTVQYFYAVPGDSKEEAEAKLRSEGIDNPRDSEWNAGYKEYIDKTEYLGRRDIQESDADWEAPEGYWDEPDDY